MSPFILVIASTYISGIMFSVVTSGNDAPILQWSNSATWHLRRYFEHPRLPAEYLDTVVPIPYQEPVKRHISQHPVSPKPRYQPLNLTELEFRGVEGYSTQFRSWASLRIF